MSKGINIALVDDHVLLREGLASLLRDLGYNVKLQACNGREYVETCSALGPIDILLLDINMPQMDGFEVAAWLGANHPETRALALSMYDDEKSIIRMIANGARGYVLKDSEPEELNRAIQDVFYNGYHYSQLVSSHLVHNLNSIRKGDQGYEKSLQLGPREIEFLKLNATEKTYKQIADLMNLSPRTIDGYRDNLFEKLNVKNRVGLVLYAVKNGIVKL